MIDARAMKRFAGLALVVLLGTVAQAQSVGTNVDRLYFRNADSLSGALQSIGPDSVRWMRPDSADAIEFASSNLVRVDMAPRSTAVEATKPDCNVYLINGDSLEGNFLSCDSTAIQLRTSYAGVLDIPRSAAKSVVFLPAPQPAIFEGPRGLEGWVQRKSSLAAATVEPGEWAYRNGAFYAAQSASIARDFKLPDATRIEFDLRWQDRFQIAIALYTDSLQPVSLSEKEKEPDFGGFYSFQIGNNYASVIAITKNDPLRYLDPVPTPSLMQTNRAHVDVRVDKKTATIALFVDGALIKKWVDTNGFVGQGTGLRFVNQAYGAVKMSHLRITAWDGRMEESPSSAPVRKSDSVWKNDGTAVYGQVQSVTNGAISVAITQGSVRVPLAQAVRLDFAGGPATSAEAAGQVHVSAGGGSRLSLRLSQWDTNNVVAVSPVLGKVTLRTESLTRVEW